MLIDGRALAGEVLEELTETVKRLAKVPRLSIVDFGTEDTPSAFVRQKLLACERIGVECRRYVMPPDISATVFSGRLNDVVRETHTDGVIVQLPLPKILDENRYGILRIIPEDRDVDCLSEHWLGRLQTGRTQLRLRHGEAELLPPVTAAIEHIVDKEDITLAGRRVVVVGWGDLVGKPSAAWFLHQGATVTVVRKAEKDLAELTRQADILVVGTGQAGLITGDMVGENAIVFDAGASEVSGTAVGDVEQDSVAKKAALLTPVPGGLGPLTVAMLLKNLTALTAARSGFRATSD